MEAGLMRGALTSALMYQFCTPSAKYLRLEGQSKAERNKEHQKESNRFKREGRSPKRIAVAKKDRIKAALEWAGRICGRGEKQQCTHVREGGMKHGFCGFKDWHEWQGSRHGHNHADFGVANTLVQNRRDHAPPTDKEATLRQR